MGGAHGSSLIMTMAEEQQDRNIMESIIHSCTVSLVQDGAVIGCVP